MSEFLGRLQLDSLSPAELTQRGSKAQLYRLLTDFPYQSDLLGKIVVPAGLVTDFASIPRIAWSIIDPEDPAIGWPSVVHDYLYGVGGDLPGSAKFTRRQADLVLVEAMAVCGAGRFIRWAVFQAVERFGASHFANL